MLKPATMQRIAVIGLKEDRPRILSMLYDLAVVQIEPLSKSAIQFLRLEPDNVNMKEVSEELLRIRSLKSALPVGARERRGFVSLAELISASKSITIDQEVSKFVHDKSRLQTQLDELKDGMDLVRDLSFVGEDLSILDLESGTSFLGTFTVAAYEKLREALASTVILCPSRKIHEGKEKKELVRVVVVVPNEQLEKFGSIIEKADLRLERIPKLKGKPEKILSTLADQKQAVEVELRDIDGKLHTLSDEYYSLILSVEEQLSIETRKLDITNSLGFTDNVFVLEGWVPEHRFKELEDVLRFHAPISGLFRIYKEGKPPTLFENPSRLKFFESFIRFYSIPQQGEFDPTLVFALTFPIFFGLMLGDIGYALVILGICYWILNRAKHPRLRAIVPRSLRAFARNIFKPSQFQKLAMAMIPGAIIGLIFGFLFNEYFGFHFNQYLFGLLNTNLHTDLPASGAFLDPIATAGLKTLLLIAGYIGLFEISFGLVLGMLNGYWVHEMKHVFGKLGWLFTAWGLAMVGLALIHHENLNPSANAISGVYLGLLLTGLGLIAFGEGPQSLIELPSIISHILSFTRLLGILLASVILAEVIDQIFLSSMTSGIALAIFGVFILVFGQLFNLVIALFEPGIQGARLIYVEFFSKFYHGAGELFEPFRGGRLYTVKEIELEEAEKLVHAN